MISLIVCGVVGLILGIIFGIWTRSIIGSIATFIATALFIGSLTIICVNAIPIDVPVESVTNYPLYRIDDTVYYKRDNTLKEIQRDSRIKIVVDEDISSPYTRRTQYDNSIWIKSDVYELVLPAEDIKELT